MKKCFFTVIFTLLCGVTMAAPVKYSLKGVLPDSLNGRKVYLYLMETKRHHIDSTVVKNGRFLLEGMVQDVCFAELRILDKGFNKGVRFALEEIPATFIYDGENLLVSGGRRTMAAIQCDSIIAAREKKLMPYHEISIAIRQYLLDLGSGTLSADSFEIMMKSDHIKEYMAVLQEADSVYTRDMKAFVKRNTDNVVGAFYLNYIDEDLSFFEKDSIQEVASMEFLNAPSAQLVFAGRSMEVGRACKDFELPDKDGQMHRLSDYIGKGRYVILDFWASWCLGCRIEIPHLIECFEKYHDKGLDFVLVSIDTNSDAWLKAIAKDESQDLGVHLLDQKSITRKLYGIASIPVTLLIDPNGIIIGNDMRGKRLDDKLKTIFEGGTEK